MADVGDSIKAMNARWSFGGEVSEAFDEHVAKSVPFYHDGHDLVAKTSDFFLSDGATCYDLGCSTGKLTAFLAKHNQGKDVEFIGIDVEPEMAAKARERCTPFTNVQIIAGDLLDFEFEPCDMIVAYYTIQFVKPKHRQILIDRLYSALNWGGALLLFEKVRGPDARFQDILTALYTDFKIDQGYGAEEILSKTRSLKGVLEPFSTQGNLDLLERAGFVDITTVIKYVCFEGFLAIK